MSLGTVTYPPSPAVAWPKDTFGGYAVGFFQYAGPNAMAGGYVTGGDAVTPNQVKMGTIEFATAPIAPNVAATAAVVYVYNLVTGKIQAFWGNTTPAGVWPEVTSGTDLSTYTGMFMVLGRG